MKTISIPKKEMFSNWKGYLWTIFLVAIVTSLGQIFTRIFSLENIIMFYLLIVVIAAIYWGLGPSIVTSILVVAVLDYFFIPPRLGFIPFRIDDFATLGAILAISILISVLANRFRQTSAESQRREDELNTLYNISRDLANLRELDPSLRIIMRLGKNILGNNVSILLPDSNDQDKLVSFSLDSDFKIDNREYAIAAWSFQNHQLAGLGTNNFYNSHSLYVPLLTSRGPVGIMVLWNTEGSTVHLPSTKSKLLQAFTDLIAVCIENIKLAEEADRAEVLKVRDKLQTTILNSISHDLRTPLVSVIGVLSSLQEEGMNLDEGARKSLVQVALEDAQRLNGLISNLLDISRIEAGTVKLFRQSTDVSELIGSALERIGYQASLRHIEIKVPADLPFVEVDSGLITQVFYNILDNAFKYSAPDSTIEISARQAEQLIEIKIADRGIGIPQKEMPHVFEKFHRIQRRENVPGTGLGLSICKGFVELHGGQILVENRIDGGTIIKFTLPLAVKEA